MLKVSRLTLVAICILIWVIAGIAYPLTPYPQFEPYQDETQFDGSSAYSLLNELVTRFPGRTVGSTAGRESAGWVADTFSSLGLQVRTQEFTTKAPLDYLTPKEVAHLTRLKPGSFSEVTGVNVIGLLPGESPEAILIGAHRDVTGTLQGAEDNASGTAAMLELARVLAKSPRRLTYIFVSFDAEEIGLVGSREYVRKLAGDNIRLAICLDMVGQKGAQFVVGYNTVSSGKRSAVWSYAFLRQFVFEEQGRESRLPNRQHLHLSLWQQTVQSTSTDSGSFVAEGIPGIGLRVSGTGPDYKRVPIHTTADMIENISAETLQLAGVMVERMVLTLETQGIRMEIDDSYAPNSGGYATDWFVSLFQVVVAILLVTMLAYDWSMAFRQVEQPMKVLRRELRWLWVLLAVALTIGCYLAWLLHASLVSWPFGANMLPIVVLPLLCLTLIRTARRRYAGAKSRETSQLVYSSVLLVLLAIGTLLFGWPTTMFMLLLPVLFGTYWTVIPLLWSCQTVYEIAIGPLVRGIAGGTGIFTAAFVAWAVTLWLVIGTYGVKSFLPIRPNSFAKWATLSFRD